MTEEHKETMATARQAWKDAGGRSSSTLAQHTLRAPGNTTITVCEYTRTKALRYMCSECMGWDGSPRADCTASLCPLYPFRPGRVKYPVAPQDDAQ
jgi:predicted RNA-binding Zn-ribbon protein involved in translation (DUF1610 family)